MSAKKVDSTSMLCHMNEEQYKSEIVLRDLDDKVEDSFTYFSNEQAKEIKDLFRSMIYVPRGMEQKMGESRNILIKGLSVMTYRYLTVRGGSVKMKAHDVGCIEGYASCLNIMPLSMFNACKKVGLNASLAKVSTNVVIDAAYAVLSKGAVWILPLMKKRPEKDVIIKIEELKDSDVQMRESLSNFQHRVWAKCDTLNKISEYTYSNVANQEWREELVRRLRQSGIATQAIVSAIDNATDLDSSGLKKKPKIAESVVSSATMSAMCHFRPVNTTGELMVPLSNVAEAMKRIIRAAESGISLMRISMRAFAGIAWGQAMKGVIAMYGWNKHERFLSKMITSSRENFIVVDDIRGAKKEAYSEEITHRLFPRDDEDVVDVNYRGDIDAKFCVIYGCSGHLLIKYSGECINKYLPEEIVSIVGYRKPNFTSAPVKIEPQIAFAYRLLSIGVLVEALVAEYEGKLEMRSHELENQAAVNVSGLSPDTFNFPFMGQGCQILIDGCIVASICGLGVTGVDECPPLHGKAVINSISEILGCLPLDVVKEVSKSFLQGTRYDSAVGRVELLRERSPTARPGTWLGMGQLASSDYAGLEPYFPLGQEVHVDEDTMSKIGNSKCVYITDAEWSSRASGKCSKLISDAKNRLLNCSEQIEGNKQKAAAGEMTARDAHNLNIVIDASRKGIRNELANTLSGLTSKYSVVKLDVSNGTITEVRSKLGAGKDHATIAQVIANNVGTSPMVHKGGIEAWLSPTGKNVIDIEKLGVLSLEQAAINDTDLIARLGKVHGTDGGLSAHNPRLEAIYYARVIVEMIRLHRGTKVRFAPTATIHAKKSYSVIVQKPEPPD